MLRMFLIVAVLFGAMLVGLAGPALAVQPEEMLDDPALEARAREISKGLRCVVCQNESIDESDAEIAADMRRLVRERLEAGDTNAEVVDRLVGYYGEFVLLRPRFNLQNFFIWAAGPLALLIGAFWYLRRTGRVGASPAAPAQTAARSPGAAPLTPEEQARLDALMKD